MAQFLNYEIAPLDPTRAFVLKQMGENTTPFTISRDILHRQLSSWHEFLRLEECLVKSGP